MTACDHLNPGSWPFEVDLVIDQELHFIDALAHCRHCGAAYVLERLDQRGRRALFRMSMPAALESGRVLKDLARGSCDINRASAEVASLKQRAPFLEQLLLADQSEPVIEALVDLGTHRLPAAAARQLSCDGAWFEKLGVEA